jgi:cell wall-associated NlpC family hydrolase
MPTDRPVPTDQDVVAAARGYLGVPWRHQGRSRAGLDCGGLVVLVARDLGLADYDVLGYSRHAQGQSLVRHFAAVMDATPPAAMRSGDVLVFAEAAWPCHAAILSTKHGRPHLIHAHALRRQVIEEPFAGEWPAKLRFVFRFRGLDG